jgi:hypothetical protein
LLTEVGPLLPIGGENTIAYDFVEEAFPHWT